jgi:hypothetical protein
MKKLALLVALAFGSFLIPQTAFADGGCSSCAVQQPDTPAIPQMPEDGSGGCSGCALPAPAPQRLADSGSCSTCAVDQPDTPVLPQIPSDGGCSGCALPTHRASARLLGRSFWRTAGPRCVSSLESRGKARKPEADTTVEALVREAIAALLANRQ